MRHADGASAERLLGYGPAHNASPPDLLRVPQVARQRCDATKLIFLDRPPILPERKPHSTSGLRTKGNPNKIQLKSHMCQLNAAF